MHAPTILSLDPGTSQTAWLSWSIPEAKPLQWGIIPNEEILDVLDWGSGELSSSYRPGFVVCEAVTSYGMAVGREVFETAYWIGEFRGRCRGDVPFILVPRLNVKIHLCGTAKAKDANIRQALIDRFGPQGTKKEPGPLYGIHSHEWSALAIATWASDHLVHLPKYAKDGVGGATRAPVGA